MMKPTSRISTLKPLMENPDFRLLQSVSSFNSYGLLILLYSKECEAILKIHTIYEGIVINS